MFYNVCYVRLMWCITFINKPSEQKNRNLNHKNWFPLHSYIVHKKYIFKINVTQLQRTASN